MPKLLIVSKTQPAGLNDFTFIFKLFFWEKLMYEKRLY